MFDRVASEFSAVSDNAWELASGVSGDLAYTVAIERYMTSLRGEPPAQQELRVTHIYRREQGQWRAIHRHADRKQPDSRHSRGDHGSSARHAAVAVLQRSRRRSATSRRDSAEVSQLAARSGVQEHVTFADA